ncbi:MAG: recombination mediator RecR [Schleiferiaceae bacterium]|jgi:recombination protein RecR|nr:MAG: recombination protein RecR [Owenweeksia sp. TMED14]|tara:strand:- start:1398 stop:2015 length:618 start_codon:yes stop_codon:yes gene_type:complete
MELPSKTMERAVRELSRLPGIGRRSALRLILYLIRQGNDRMENLASSIQDLGRNVQFCENCHSISDSPKCSICSDPKRDDKSICVVEDIRDVLALEKTNAFRGKYHVLGGLISPMDGLGPSDLTIEELVNRIKSNDSEEVIMALSATMEGDTTAFYIYRQIGDLPLKLTSIARGLPIGDSLEYADEITLSKSLQQRVLFESTLSN